MYAALKQHSSVQTLGYSQWGVVVHVVLIFHGAVHHVATSSHPSLLLQVQGLAEAAAEIAGEPVEVKEESQLHIFDVVVQVNQPSLPFFAFQCKWAMLCWLVRFIDAYVHCATARAVLVDCNNSRTHHMFPSNFSCHVSMAVRLCCIHVSIA